MRQQAVWSAVAICAEVLGRVSTKPVVLQDTNNVVIHLAPGPVVAKVGRWPHSTAALDLELRVARHLASLGAPVAVPIGDLVVDPGTHMPVTLWERLELTGELPEPADAAAAIHAVHAGLTTYPDPLPGWLEAHDLAAATLADDAAMAALPPDDLAVLRKASAAWIGAARQLDPGTFVPLHGEPHAGNVVATTAGTRLIDFEATCIGPLESDLSCMDPAIVEAGGFHPDPAILDLCGKLRSAFVATWCWASSHPDMRPPGEHHLELVRASY